MLLAAGVGFVLYKKRPDLCQRLRAIPTPNCGCPKCRERCGKICRRAPKADDAPAEEGTAMLPADSESLEVSVEMTAKATPEPTPESTPKSQKPLQLGCFAGVFFMKTNQNN